MAKKRPTQVGLPLEGVIYRAELLAPMLLKPWLHVTQLAGDISVTIYLMSNSTTPFERVEVEQILARKPGGSHDGSFRSKDTDRSSTDECKYFTVTTTKGTNRSHSSMPSQEERNNMNEKRYDTH